MTRAGNELRSSKYTVCALPGEPLRHLSTSVWALLTLLLPQTSVSVAPSVDLGMNLTENWRKEDCARTKRNDRAVMDSLLHTPPWVNVSFDCLWLNWRHITIRHSRGGLTLVNKYITLCRHFLWGWRTLRALTLCTYLSVRPVFLTVSCQPPLVQMFS